MNANYYLRSSANFNNSDNNIVGVLSPGSTITVLQKKILGKAEAMQVRVTSMPPPGYVKLAKEYWVYKPNNRDFVQTSAEEKAATEGGSISTPCTDCAEPAQQTAATATRNTGDIAEITRTITARDNQVQGSLDDIITKYSESDEVKYSIEYALKHKKARSQGYCYRSVKRALLAAPPGKKGLIPERMWDQAALMAKNNLKKYNFVNLLDIEPYKTTMKSPSQAPKGAVLVYSSGIPCGETVRDCGHIEIKTSDAGKPGYVSDYYSKDAINETPAARRYGTSYKLVGVMIKK